MEEASAFDRNPAAFIEDCDAAVAALVAYDRHFSGAYFDVLSAETEPDRISAQDIVAVTTLSVEVPPRVAAWILTNALEVSALLRAIPQDPIWEVERRVLTDPAGPLTTLWNLLQSERAQAPPSKNANGVGYVIAGKVLAAKRPHLVPIIDKVTEEALGYRAQGRWWESWHLTTKGGLPGRADEIRRQALAHQENWRIRGLSTLRLLDIVIWMRWYGHRKLPADWHLDAGIDVEHAEALPFKG